MPKRDEELEYEYEEEAEGFDDDEYEDEEAYDDDEYEDDDEEYEDDEEDEEGAGGNWRRRAILALGLVTALGGGAYAYMSGMLPFSPKQPEVAQETTSPYANPHAFGKVHATPGVPPVSKAVPDHVAAKPADAAKPAAEAAKPAEATKPAAKPEAKPAAIPAAKPPVETKVAAEKPAKVASKPVAHPAPVKPAAKIAKHPAPVQKAVPKAQPAVAHAAPSTSGSYAVQCGAFASSTNANNLVHVLSSKGFPAWLSNGSGESGGAFAVRSTVVDSKAKAQSLMAKFASTGHPGAILPAGHGHYMLQLGIFSARPNAEALASELKAKGMFVSVAGGKARLHSPSKVLVGRFATWNQAQAEARKVRGQGVPAIVVHL